MGFLYTKDSLLKNMLQPIIKQIKMILTASVLTLGIISSLSLGGSLNTQAAPVYTCPAGQVLEGNQCQTIKCIDNTPADTAGNCSINQGGLFSCNGPTPPGEISMVFPPSLTEGICTNRPDIYKAGKCPDGFGLLPGGPSPFFPNGPDFDKVLNSQINDNDIQNKFCAGYIMVSNATAYPSVGLSGAVGRVCPFGYGAMFIANASARTNLGSTNINRYTGNENNQAICRAYNASTPYTQGFSRTYAGCEERGKTPYGYVYYSNVGGSLAQLCGPATPQLASKVGSKTSVPATISSYTIENSNVGTGSCTNSNTVVQGSTINCNFPLTGSTNGVYTIPAAGLLGGVLKVNGVITNESNYFGPSSACTIAGAVLTCTNIPVGVDATPGNHEVVILEPNVSWYRNKGSVNVTARPVAVTGTEISSINTGNGSCNPTEIRTGDLTSCSYSLTGSSINEYKLPSTPITAKISTVSTNSAPCQIFNNGTINASLICANVPSLGGTIGDQSAKLDLMGETNTAPIKLLAANTGTVISQSNTGAGKCTPGTITVGNLTLCDFALKGAMDNTYLLPLSGIKAKISTASSSSNPCQVSNNGTLQASITCTQVPTSGAIPGNQTAKLDLADETDTNPVTLIASVTTLGTNPQGQLEGKVGSPVTGFISTTSSTYSGPATYNNGANCVIPGVISLGIFTPVQGTLVPMTCPTGTLSNGVLKATGNVDLGSVKSNFAKTELTMDDIKKVNVICNDGKAITVNSTTTCTFELPENKTLPKDLFFGIGDAKPAGTCTIKDKTVTCINIPTGTKTGVQSLNSQMNDGSVFDTGKKVTVNAKVILAKTGNSNAIFLGMISLAATIFSLSFATRLELVRARK